MVIKILPWAKRKGWNLAEPTLLTDLDVTKDCRGPPWWWPLTSQMNHCTHLWRILRTDRMDWKQTDHTAKHLPDDGSIQRSPKFVREVLRAVRHGSIPGFDNAFLPTSTNIEASRVWRSRADNVNSKQLQMREGHYRVCLCINIWAWFQSGTMPPGALIDLSTPDAQMKIYEQSADTKSLYGVNQSDYDIACKWSIACREVLVKWRGEVPMEYCDVVDDMDVYSPIGNIRSILNFAEERGMPMDSVAVTDWQDWQLTNDLAFWHATVKAESAPPSSSMVWGLLLDRCPPAHPPPDHLRSMQQVPTAKDSTVALCHGGKKRKKVLPYGPNGPPSPIAGDLDISEGSGHEPAVQTLESKASSDLFLDKEYDTTIQFRCEASISRLERLEVPEAASAASLKEFSVRKAATAVTQDAAPGDLRAEDVCVLATMVRIRNEKDVEACRQAMSAPVFAIFEKIVALEIDYNAKLAQLTLVHSKSMKLSYSPADVYHDEWMSADVKGLDKPRQCARRTFTQTVTDLKGHRDFRDAKIELLREHGTRLVDMGAVSVVDALPVSWPSKQALELMGKLKVTNPARSSSSGSQRGPVYLPHMSYKELLVREGLIKLPRDFVGRKPSCGCYEARLTLAEEAEGYDWANWWLRLGGFQAPIMRLLYWLESTVGTWE